MSRSFLIARTALAVFVACLLVAGGCAKKAKQTEEGETQERAAAGEAMTGSGGATSASEEDIPLANQATLDSQGRLRKDVASAAGVGDSEGAALLVEDIHFAFDSSELDSDAKAKLREVKTILDRRSTWVVTLEGHCDERGTEEYNLGLGNRRASSAKSFLMGLGVSASRIDTVSFGESYPVDPEHNEAAWAKNRRVHFAFSQSSPS